MRASTRILFDGVELRSWERRYPSLLERTSGRCEDALGLACADYPAGSIIEYEVELWDNESSRYIVAICRWEIVATGWFVRGGRRWEKPGAAYVRVDGLKEIEDPVNAIGIVEGSVPNDNFDLEMAAWQKLIDTGLVWDLEGWFGRRARHLIEIGLCKEAT